MPSFSIRDFLVLPPKAFLDKDEPGGVAAAHLVAQLPNRMRYDRTMPPFMHVLTLHFPGHCRTILDIGGERLIDGLPPPSTLTFAPAGERVRATVSEGIDLLQLFVSVPWLDALTRDIFTRRLPARPAPLHPFFTCDPALHHLGQAMLHVLADDDGPCRRRQFEAIATAFMTRVVSGHLSDPGAPHGRLAGLRQSDLHLVLRLIDERLDLPLSVAHLAGAVKLSKFHFSHAFRQSTGLSPGRFVQKRRMERARDLLRCQSMAVADVAASVGYDDPSHFASLFRREYGVSPRDFRHAQ